MAQCIYPMKFYINEISIFPTNPTNFNPI